MSERLFSTLNRYYTQKLEVKDPRHHPAQLSSLIFSAAHMSLTPLILSPVHGLPAGKSNSFAVEGAHPSWRGYSLLLILGTHPILKFSPERIGGEGAHPSWRVDFHFSGSPFHSKVLTPCVMRELVPTSQAPTPFFLQPIHQVPCSITVDSPGIMGWRELVNRRSLTATPRGRPP